MFKDYPIQKFGSKLMVSSKAINTIPNFYLSYSQNARIYDGWIWPRRWKQILTESTLWTNNKGWFVLNGKLYQVTNSKIYEIDQTTWVQTEKATLWYDWRIDVLTFTAPKGNFISLWNYTPSYDETPNLVWRLRYIKWTPWRIDLQKQDWTATYSNIPLWISNAWYIYPAIKINYTWTTWGTDNWTGQDTWTWYILEDWEYMELGSTQSIWNINYDVWYYDKKTLALIVSEWQKLQVFDWSSLAIPWTQPAANSWMIEYCRGYSFLAYENILFISRPITNDNPEYAYDFTWSWSQTISFDTTITGLKWTMNWLYIFTDTQVHYLWANSLQNVAWSATFITQPLWDSAWPINNLCIAWSWDKIFYLTKNLQIQTINYIEWTASTQIGELSARPVISIRKLLETIDTDQPNAYAFYNENDKTIQMHLRSVWSPLNDTCIVYDLINDTWNIDTWKFYNYVVKNWPIYYWFSDINSSIYKDDTWYSDNWVAIDFKIQTQNIIIWPNQTFFGGFYIKGWIWNLTELWINANIDWFSVFSDTISGSEYPIEYLWEIWWDEIGWEIAWPLTYIPQLNPFDKRANQWRIFRMWNRIDYEITSQSQIQDFIIDMLWTTAEASIFTDTKNTF